MAFFTQTEAFRKAGLFRKGTALKALPYQDPTYLGFLLMFDYIDAKQFSGDVNGTAIPDAIISSPLFDPSGAEAYLTKLSRLNKKYEAKLNALKAFKDGLKNINLNMPWYWQSLTGLDKVQAYNPMEPHLGKDGNELVLSCLESVNLAITGLMRNYREAVFDEETWTYVLPPNLRKFSVKIYIADIRPLFNEENSSGKTVAQITEPNKIGKVSEFNIDPNINDQQATEKESENDLNTDLVGSNKKPYLSFHLTNCEWNMQTGVSSFTELKNNAPEMASQIIAFKYERLTRVEMISMNGIIDETMIGSDGAQAPESIKKPANLSRFEKAKQRATEDMKNLAEKKKQEAISAASNLVRDKSGIPFTMDGMKPKLETEGIYMNLVNKLDNAANVQRLNTREIAQSLLGNVYFTSGQTVQAVLDNGLRRAMGNVYL